MDYKFINPTGSAYSEGVEIKNFSRIVFVSGQVPADEAIEVPKDFADQCRLVWKNVEKQLKHVGMELHNIVKLTIFLSDRQYRQENIEVRRQVLGEHQPAMTIIITGIYDEAWLLEIEAIAAE